MLSAQFVKILRELNAEVTLTSLQVLIQKSHLMEVETCRVRSLTSHSLCVEKPLRCVWELQDALRLSWLLNAISLSSSTTSVPSVPSSKPRAKTNQLHSQPSPCWRNHSCFTSPSMYFSKQMAQSDVELLLSVSSAPQLPSRCPLLLDLNFLVSIFSSACTASLFMEFYKRRKKNEKGNAAV